MLYDSGPGFSSSKIQSTLFAIAETIFARHFGKRYLRKRGLPKCVIEQVTETFPEESVPESSEEEFDWEVDDGPDQTAQGSASSAPTSRRIGANQSANTSCWEVKDGADLAAKTSCVPSSNISLDKEEFEWQPMS